MKAVVRMRENPLPCHDFVNIEDLRKAAQRRLPRSVFDYIDGGADGEVTLRENVRAFEDIGFRPRCAVETPPPDLRTTVLGTPIALPFIFAPVGSSRMFWPRGEEVAAARRRIGRDDLLPFHACRAAGSRT